MTRSYGSANLIKDPPRRTKGRPSGSTGTDGEKCRLGMEATVAISGEGAAAERAESEGKAEPVRARARLHRCFIHTGKIGVRVSAP
jgi:hypothetical protein